MRGKIINSPNKLDNDPIVAIDDGMDLVMITNKRDFFMIHKHIGTPQEKIEKMWAEFSRSSEENNKRIFENPDKQWRSNHE